MPIRSFLAWIACGYLFAVFCTAPLDAMELITLTEARLPDDTTQTRGISRGPVVSLVTPAPNAGMIRSPFDFKVKFESFQGARIDPDAVLVTYKKMPAIDLTQRVKKFIDGGGINVQGVEVPPGEHRIRIDITDSGGRKGWTDFTIKVLN